MYEDTRINSLEIKEERRQRELAKARDRHFKLEGIRLAYEEKKRIRREMRLQRKHEKKQFEHSVVTLQSAYRGSKDREKYQVIVGEKRQRVSGRGHSRYVINTTCLQLDQWCFLFCDAVRSIVVGFCCDGSAKCMAWATRPQVSFGTKAHSCWRSKENSKKIYLPTEFEGGTGVAGKSSRGARQAQPRSASGVPARVRDDVAVFLQRLESNY